MFALPGLGPLTVKRIGSIALDLAIAAGALVCAYLVAVGPVRLPYVPGLVEKTAGFTACAFASFVVFNVHRGSWRYVSVPDLLALIKAVLCAVVVYTLAAFLVSRADNVPRSVPILSAIFLLIGLASVRLAYRLVMDGLLRGFGTAALRRPDARNVLLVGLTDAAESYIRNVRRDSNAKLNVLGILEEEAKHHARLIHGVKVLGPVGRLSEHVERFRRHGIPVSDLILAEPRPGRQRLNDLVDLATGNGLKVSRLPDLTETASISGDGSVEPMPIQLEDLLGRPEVTTDVQGIATFIEGSTILATGAGGSIGSELCRQIARFGPRSLIITDASEHLLYLLDKQLRDEHPDLPIVTQIANVCDGRRIWDIMHLYRPDIVFHAAALKHVPIVEDNPVEAIKTNVFGTRNVADAAFAAGVRTFVMISTDKAVNPTNVMGATKRAAEAYCQALDVVSETTRFKTVRFGNVLGSNGSVVPRFKEQIRAGGPVTVTHPHIVRYFMTIPEAVRLVLHASAHALRHIEERGKIMVLDMGKPVRILDLAERMIRLAGFRPHVDVKIAYVGLRPGEKLYEELFDPSEVQDVRTSEGYVVASPRVIDRTVLLRSLEGLQSSVEREDTRRAIELLSHIVPEYRKSEPVADVDQLIQSGSMAAAAPSTNAAGEP